MVYTPTIGLEIHAELKTRTKMFCDSANDPNEKRPNWNICPVCMAHPGVLPVINKGAVRHVLRVGTMVGGKIANFTEFDRKNYFYPDIPKGYQISQYKHPLITGGALLGISITRIHLEEDTARSQHLSAQAGQGEEGLIDFNRAGVPLMELVTEPVIYSAKEAVNFARELQLLLRTLGAGEANMEQGQMRVEANISVSSDPTRFGTKVEIKNLNSFRSVERAIEYEISRQVALVEGGGKVAQETRGWDEARQQTFSQRLKEESHDYRYFPDPDLPKLYLSRVPEFAPGSLLSDAPELPTIKRTRLVREWGIKAEDAEVFVAHHELSNLLHRVIEGSGGNADIVRLAVNYITNDLLGLLEADSWRGLSHAEDLNVAGLATLIADGKLSSRGAKEVLTIMYREGGEPEAIAATHGLIQVRDEKVLRSAVLAVLASNEKVVKDYKEGKEAALQYLVGQVMRETRGSADPSVVRRILAEAINS